MLDFDTYQNEASKTAQYPGAGTGTGIALAYVGLGLGEAGEIQNQIKKILRDDNGVLTDARRTAILKELGDLLWYIARTCSEISVPMENVAAANLIKLEDRAARGVLGGSGDNR